MARKLYIDVDAGQFVESVNSNIPVALGNLFENDSADYELYFLRRDPTGAFLYEAQDFSAKSVKLHIAPAPPSTATAFVAQNTWTNLPSIVSAVVTRTLTGGPVSNEQQRLTFSPDAQSGTFSLTIPARTITVSGVAAGLFTASDNHGLAVLEPFTITGLTAPTGGLSNGQTLFASVIVNPTQFRAAATRTTTPNNAFAADSGGTASTVTASTRLVAGRATGAEVQAALEALPSVGTGNVVVLASPGREYRIGYQGEKGQVPIPVATVAAALTPLFGKTATLNFATTQLAAALSGNASLQAALEVETTESGNVDTVLQVPVTLRNDIIDGASPLPVSTTTATFFTLLSPDNSVFAVSVDDNGILTTEKIS
jgi:hypothetical protein